MSEELIPEHRIHGNYDMGCPEFVVDVEYARELKRELNQLKAQCSTLIQENAELREDSEMEDCPNCGGVGELPGDPHTKVFPKCHQCEGKGEVPV